MANNKLRHIARLWAWKKLREWLKINCVDINYSRLGDIKYCLDMYFLTQNRNRPHKKAMLVLFDEYNNPKSPIFKGIKVPGLSLNKYSKISKRERRKNYDSYLKSNRWREFKKLIIDKRGEMCEKCGVKATDLHHKTYARLFNELPEDVLLLCRSCHEAIHRS